MTEIVIGNKHIGGDLKNTFIIAEAGSNHNNDLSIAKELIDVAVEAKCDAVKFQLFKADKHYSKYTPTHSYYQKDLYSLIKSLELNRNWIEELKKYADSKNIVFLQHLQMKRR